MSQKQIKKTRKEIKKVVNKNFGTGMDALNKITRKRPRWVPKRIWVFVYLPLFERKYLGAVLKHLE